MDYSRDDLLPQYSKDTLKDRYFVEGEKSPQEAFMRAAKAFSDNSEHAERLYNYASKLWFMFSTPILSNGGTNRGMPISCFLCSIQDSRKAIADHYTENMFLASVGGGIGSDWSSLRTAGVSTSSGSQSNGVMPFIKVVDSEIMAVSQGKTRRGSYAYYLHISHPDIEEAITSRKPTGGDSNRKCLNLHNAVVVPDSFYHAVAKDADWELIDPHTKKVMKTIKARELWRLIIETRLTTGEPYILNIDSANRAISPHHRALGLTLTTSNLCVAPETMILTSEGYRNIKSLVDQDVLIWNGKEYSQVKVINTSRNSKLITVKFSDGSELSCTEYHKFYIQKGYTRGTGDNKLALETKEAKDLKVGDRLQKWDLPVITKYSKNMKDPYTQGAFSGDGCSQEKTNHIDLYMEKDSLRDKLVYISCGPYSETQNRRRVQLDSSYVKYEVPLDCPVNERLEWLAGLLDTDGCILTTSGTPQLQIASSNKEFLNSVKYLLNTLGVEAKILLGAEAGYRRLPDHRGGYKEYWCNKINRLCIAGVGVQKLLDLGLTTYRLVIPKHDCNRSATHFVKVSEIIDSGRYDETYCFNEPIRHAGIFNGVLAGNCSEILEPVSEDRTAVCCLSSVNLEKYDDWKDDAMFIEDLVRMLDNALQHFIDNAPNELKKAKYSASRERSIGLGAMGFHSYIQSKNIPFEGPLASGLNRSIFKNIKEKAESATVKLGLERGSCPDSSGEVRRNIYLLAIAPNASSSIIADTSPSVEPWRANAYTHKTLSGSFLVKNKHLINVLESYNKNTDEIWKSIITNEGSVQHLEFLSEWEKEVFKTAMEIDQKWIVDHAATRQEYICQSQSINLFFPSDVDITEVHRVHWMAWERGLKTLYYCRSTPARRIKSISEKVERSVREDAEDCFSCQG